MAVKIMNEESEISLDLDGIADEKALHEYLFGMLHFPDYYGSNWDAFDECIRDVDLPQKLKIHHFAELEARVPRGARLLKDCLECFANENPGRIEIEFCQQRQAG